MFKLASQNVSIQQESPQIITFMCSEYLQREVYLGAPMSVTKRITYD